MHTNLDTCVLHIFKLSLSSFLQLNSHVRLLAFGNVRKVTNSPFQSPIWKTGFIEVKCKEANYTVRFPCYQWSMFYHCKHTFSGESHFLLDKVGQKLMNKSCSRNFYFLSKSNTVSYQAQVAWKRLSQMCACYGSVLQPAGKVACAMSLALTRSNLVAPRVIAFIIGELAWTQRTWAESGSLLTRDNSLIQAQDGHVFLSTLVFLLLEGVMLLFRAIYLVFLFLPCISMAPFVDYLGLEFRKNWLRIVHLTLEKAGPAFIKWGQWAATRPDLFPRDLCSELSKLHSKVPAHSFAITKKTIEKAFGRRLPDIFADFEEEPIASGSVAQVHRATLKYRYPGQQIKPILVAVKVRHPCVGEAIRRDFLLINFVAKISGFLPTLRWLRLDESIQQFAVFMMSQVDLAREAAHLSRFIYNFQRWKNVSFPMPLYPLVHPAVLVETYEQGDSIMHYVDELEGNEAIKASLAHIGMHAFLKMLLVDNFIHADMHPGNILVRLADSKPTRKQLFGLKPHLVFLDVGMTAELSKKDQVTLLEFFKAVSQMDGRTVAECTLRLSKKQQCPDPGAFIEEVDQCFKYWVSPHTPNFHPAECMQQLLEHVRRHKVNIDGDVCTVMVTTLVLEGWQQKLDPEYDVLQALRELFLKVDWADSLVYTIEGIMAP